MNKRERILQLEASISMLTARVALLESQQTRWVYPNPWVYPAPQLPAPYEITWSNGCHTAGDTTVSGEVSQ